MSFLTFPYVLAPPDSMTWRLRANTQVHESPLDGTSQTLLMPGSRWVGSMTWPKMDRDMARIISAFVARMNGRAGRFLLQPLHAPRIATAGGTPRVMGAGQSGDLLQTDGWEAGKTVIVTGDFLSFSSPSGRPQIHMAVASAVSNGSGYAPIRIAPPLRSPPADGAAIEVNAPVGVFRLADDDQGDLATDAAWHSSIAVEFEEALF